MSRYLESVDTIKKTTNLLMEICDNQEEVTGPQISGIYNILTDIALSLAMIADKMDKNMR